MQDELLMIANEWSLEQLNHYIRLLEARIVMTKDLVKDLKVIQRNKSRRKTVDTGSPRGGK